MSQTESILIKALAETLAISVEDISPTKQFDEYDIDSLDAIQFLMEVEESGGPKIEVESMYDHPSIRALAAFVDGAASSSNAAGEAISA